MAKISKSKIALFYIGHYWKRFFASFVLLISLIYFFHFSFSRSLTGKFTEHNAVVIGVSVSHSYGPLTQDLHVLLPS
jgi:hypothetical protein